LWIIQIHVNFFRKKLQIVSDIEEDTSNYSQIVQILLEQITIFLQIPVGPTLPNLIPSLLAFSRPQPLPHPALDLLVASPPASRRTRRDRPHPPRRRPPTPCCACHGRSSELRVQPRLLPCRSRPPLAASPAPTCWPRRPPEPSALIRRPKQSVDRGSQINWLWVSNSVFFKKKLPIVHLLTFHR
jgi:hypothetical protein